MQSTILFHIVAVICAYELVSAIVLVDPLINRATSV